MRRHGGRGYQGRLWKTVKFLELGEGSIKNDMLERKPGAGLEGESRKGQEDRGQLSRPIPRIPGSGSHAMFWT